MWYITLHHNVINSVHRRDIALVMVTWRGIIKNSSMLTKVAWFTIDVALFLDVIAFSSSNWLVSTVHPSYHRASLGLWKACFVLKDSDPELCGDPHELLEFGKCGFISCYRKNSLFFRRYFHMHLLQGNMYIWIIISLRFWHELTSPSPQ